MKNNRTIIFTIVCILNSLFSYAQLNVKLPTNITLQLPKGAVWYNDSTYTNRLADRLGSKRFSENINKYTYKFKEMVLKFNEINSTIGKDYLIKEKRSLELDFKKEAVLKDINGNQFVIMVYSSKQSNVCIFSCINPAGTKGVRGSINFNELQNNKEYYFNIIDEMLKTIRFVE